MIDRDSLVLYYTCQVLVGVPPASASEAMGLSSGIETAYTLECCEVPQKQIVSKDQSGYIVLPMQLLVYDPDRRCAQQSVILYNTVRYRVTAMRSASKHNYRTVTLEQLA